MKTVSSNENLIYWKRNENGSQIVLPKLFLQNHFANVFQTLADKMEEKVWKVGFIGNAHKNIKGIWHEVMSEEVDAVRTELHAYKWKGDAPTDEVIEYVCNKFQGNLGEIFAELFFTNFAGEICIPSTYLTVDPTDERFNDAVAESSASGLKIGVQVKNYSFGNIVERKTFVKAMAMRAFAVQGTDDSKLPIFKSAPTEIIFSMNETTDNLSDEYKQCVMFLGPSFIDSKCLAGDPKTGRKGPYALFKKVAEEIKNLK